MPNCTAVARSDPPNRNPPSPQIDTTGLSGCATFTPSAVGNPYPNVPLNPEVIMLRGL